MPRWRLRSVLDHVSNLKSLTSTDELPLWKAAIDVAAVTCLDYRSPYQKSTYVQPPLYLLYPGQRLKVHGSEPRGRLFESEWLELDLSQGGDASGTRRQRCAPARGGQRSYH